MQGKTSILGTLLLTLVLGLTFFGSMWQTLNSGKREVEIVSPIAELTTVVPTPTEAPSPTPTRFKVKITTTVTPNPDPFAIIFEGPEPTVRTAKPPEPGKVAVAAAPTKESRCIITIDSQRYDVIIFRQLHSGGDIFRCGTDMSNTFHQRHPDSFLQTMTSYKI